MEFRCWNLNRAISLSVTDLDEDIEDTHETTSSIVNSFNANFIQKKNNNSINVNTNEINEDNNIEIFADLWQKFLINIKIIEKF